MPQSPDTPWDHEDVKIISNKIEEPSFEAAYFLTFLKSQNIKTGKIVDLGCGNGNNSVFFSKNNFEVFAIDKSDDILRLVEGYNVKTICQDVSDYLLFENGFFDFAFDIRTYDQLSIEKKENYCNELRRVLKQGGFLLLSTNTKKEIIEKEFSEFIIEEKKSNLYILK